MPAYFAAGLRARLASWRGNQAALTLACRDAAARAKRADRQPLPMAISLVAQAESLLWAGEAERELELATRASDLAMRTGTTYRAVCLANRARAAADVADAARRQGRAVEVSAADLLDLASHTNAPERAAVHAYVATALAEVERLQGRRDTAPWRVAVAAWSRTEDTYQAACAELRLSWALGGPNQVASASASPCWDVSPPHATTSDRVGAAHLKQLRLQLL